MIGCILSAVCERLFSLLDIQREGVSAGKKKKKETAPLSGIK
jgi:hypothetical protein